MDFYALFHALGESGLLSHYEQLHLSWLTRGWLSAILPASKEAESPSRISIPYYNIDKIDGTRPCV